MDGFGASGVVPEGYLFGVEEFLEFVVEISEEEGFEDGAVGGSHFFLKKRVQTKSLLCM